MLPPPPPPSPPTPPPPSPRCRRSPFRHRKECFKIGHDIAMPQRNAFFRRPGPDTADWLAFLRARAALPHNAHFHGNFDATGQCSPNVRQWIRRQCRCDARAKPPAAARACGCPEGSPKSSIYSLCPAGYGCWSVRFFDAVDRLSIPVILADGIVEPHELFFDYTAFTAKAVTATTLPDHKERRRRGMQRLQEAAESFREACAPGAVARAGAANASEPPPVARAFNATECLRHPVALKLAALNEVRPWFSFNSSAPKNVYKLFLLELRCRLPGSLPWCANLTARSAVIYHKQYG